MKLIWNLQKHGRGLQGEQARRWKGPAPASLSATGLPRRGAGHLRGDVNECHRGTEREQVGLVLTGEPTLVLPCHCGKPRRGRLPGNVATNHCKSRKPSATSTSLDTECTSPCPHHWLPWPTSSSSPSHRIQRLTVSNSLIEPAADHKAKACQACSTALRSFLHSTARSPQSRTVRTGCCLAKEALAPSQPSEVGLMGNQHPVSCSGNYSPAFRGGQGHTTPSSLFSVSETPA